MSNSPQEEQAHDPAEQPHPLETIAGPTRAPELPGTAAAENGGATSESPSAAEVQATAADTLTTLAPQERPVPAQPVVAADPFLSVAPVTSDDPSSTMVRGRPRQLPLEAGPCWPSVPGYKIQGELGRGGMGVVYKARQTRLNRLVALKMILAGGHAGAEERLRFLAEGEAIAAVKHPGIVQVFDFGTQDGLPYFSMEFCSGGSLAGKLAGTPLAAREAAGIVKKVCQAVQAAHERGIVHRDLKPANVLLAEDGEPKVTDFGLAKRTEGGTGMTHTGSVMGTPSYMAPEQAEGKKDIGPPADVYALGAVLYDCLTGRPPFRAATVFETLQQVVRDEPVPPRQLNPAVPKDLETVCLSCLHKNPVARYSSAAALADDLGRWLAGEPIAARPAGPMERAIKWARRRPTAAMLLGVSVLGALGLAVLSVVAVAQWQSAVAALKSKRQAEVKALLTAHPRAVPDILRSLRQEPEVVPRLRVVWDEADVPANRLRRMRAALALLPVEPALVRDALVEWMLEVPDPAELLVIRDALGRHAEELSPGLWQRLQRPGTTAAAQLRILAALAAFDHRGAGWQKAAAAALPPWLSDDPLYLGAWTEALRPAHDSLLGPLTDVFKGKQLAERRLVASRILADYALDRPQTLADLVVEADDRQFAYLLPALQRKRQQVLPLLRREADQQANPQASEAAREELARRQSGAALALLKLGHAELVWPLLEHSPSPETRSRITLRLGPIGMEASALAERLWQEKDSSTRRALILALGEYRAEQVPLELRQRLVEKLLLWYRVDPDAGIHGAIDWLLRHGKEGKEKRPLDWGQAKTLQKIDRELARRPRAERSWYVNGQGQTLTVVDSQEPFLMGSPDDEKGRDINEKLQRMRIGRRYAIATKPVSVLQFERFRKAHPEVSHSYKEQYSPEADCPINSVTWYEAAQYCRWLSKQECVPPEQMCYPSVAEIEKCKKNGAGPLKLPADYLKRTGYRLPTEEEWEFACRAGAKTSRYYGSSLELLPRYAWYSRNAEDQTWPVGQKRPNDLGLFDMHGNVWNWCQESTGLIRGASYRNAPTIVRAGYRNFAFGPSQRLNSVGLRVARTCD